MKKLPPVLLCLALALPATANVVHFPGLWQSRFNAPTAYGFAVAGDASNNTVPVLASNLVAVTASDYLDRTPGLLMGYSAGSGPAPKQNPISGRSWGWYNYDVYAYEGEMFVEAGRTYQFYGRYYSLQARRDGRNVTRYVPAERLEAAREATANYRRFMELVKRYVALCERRFRL